MRRRALLFFLLVCAGRGGIQAPRVGYWRDAQNRMRALEGVARSFIPGPVLRENALALAWYGGGGWLRTSGILERLDESGATVDRYPLGPGEVRLAPNAAWLVDEGAIVRWTGSALQYEYAVDPQEFALPQFPLADEVESAEPMGPGWWHLRAGGRSHALRTTPGREALFVMPDPEDNDAQP